MGIFKVSTLGWVTTVLDFSQRSLENTMDAVYEVQQTIIEMPINLAQELGFPEQRATALKDKHRRILGHLKNGICGSCLEVNRFIIKQVTAVDQLASFESPPDKATAAKTERKKGTAEAGSAGAAIKKPIARKVPPRKKGAARAGSAGAAKKKPVARKARPRKKTKK